MTWMPISEAPQDGTPFIGLVERTPFKTWWQAYYDKWPHEEGGPTFKYGWNCDMGDKHMPCHPTHWIPLPQPPKEESKQ